MCGGSGGGGGGTCEGVNKMLPGSTLTLFI